MPPPRPLWKREAGIPPGESDQPRIRLNRGEDWASLDDITKIISWSIRGRYNGVALSGTKMEDDVKMVYWRRFYQKVEYDMDLAEQVYLMWHSRFCALLKGLVYREKKAARDKPLPHLDEPARGRMWEQREDPAYQHRCEVYKENRMKQPHRCEHYGGSMPANKYVRMMEKAGEAVNPADVYEKYRCRKDPDGTRFWNDPSSGEIYEKYEEQVRAAGVDHNSVEAHKMFFEVAGGYNVKNQSVYGLGSATEMFYERPARRSRAQGQGSSSSAPIPGAYAVLASEHHALKNTVSQQSQLLAQMFEKVSQMEQREKEREHREQQRFSPSGFFQDSTPNGSG